MLHYFARKFFSRLLISPYIDGSNITVYYISDDSHAKHGDAALYQSINNPSTVSRSRSLNGKFPKKNVVHMNARSTGFEDVHVIMGRCYKWKSFETGYEWNMTFQTVCSFFSFNITIMFAQSIT